MERLNVQNSFAAFSLFFIFRRLVFWAVTFMMAVRPTSRRAGTRDERRGCDRRANLLYTRGEAREGYAQVSFLGAQGVTI